MTAAAHPSLCLVPGMGKTSTLWDSQREALAAGYDAVVADYRGSGSVSETTERVLVSMCDWASR